MPYKKFEDKQTKKCAKACDDNSSFIDYIVLCGMDNYLKVFLTPAQATQVTPQAGAWHKDKADTAVGGATDNIEFEQTQVPEGRAETGGVRRCEGACHRFGPVEMAPAKSRCAPSGQTVATGRVLYIRRVRSKYSFPFVFSPCVILSA